MKLLPKPDVSGIPLPDLFVPPAALTSLPSRSSEALELTVDITRQAALAGLLPDTPFAAAWVLAQHQWRGVGEVSLGEIGAHGGWLTAQHAAAADMKVADWLRAVDAKRRAPTPDADVAADSLWLGTSPATVPDDTAMALGLRVLPRPELFIDFASAVLDRDQARAVLAAVLRTAQSLLAGPEARLSEIDTLGPEQARQLLVEWNPPLSPYDPSLTVHGQFSRVAQLHGDATALVCRGERMSYRELERRSSLMAARIRAAGVMPSGVVCVALERSAEAVVVLLGILKAGAAYLPVDTGYPAERLAFMLADAAASLVVTTSAHRQVFPASVPALLIDALPTDAIEAQPAHQDPAGGQALAYIMYTSGSTGTPKGIEICHHSIIRLVIDAKYVDLSPAKTMLHAAPLGFDASTLELWGPLLNGGRCVLHDEELPTAAGLARTIRNEGVTTAWLTAALFNAVVDDDPAHLRGLEQLLIGGEALSVAHVRRALDALPAMTLINGYGPTECTTFTATYRIPHDLPREARSVPIGRPITDTP
ncbi:MAG TPA: AMP-binding protein, partial [Albitalea sp.]|nr:AMP-binding protein [Albitalea sp.]